MEAHCLIDMPFDEFFAEAERRGLMSAATKSSGRTKVPREAVAGDVERPVRKAEQPKPSASASSASKPSASSATKPNAPSTPKLREPGEDDEEDEEEEGEETTPCDFCAEPIGLDDLVCGACKASFEDDGKSVFLSGLPCRACGEIVPIDTDSTQFACAKCHTTHSLTPTLGEFEAAGGLEGGRLQWALVEKTKEQRATRGRRGSARTATAELDEKIGKDNIPF
jgi:hypothetical protein